MARLGENITSFLLFLFLSFFLCLAPCLLGEIQFSPASVARFSDNGEHEDGRNGVAVEIMWMMNFPFRRNGIFVTYETEEYVEVSQTDL